MHHHHHQQQQQQRAWQGTWVVTVGQTWTWLLLWAQAVLVPHQHQHHHLWLLLLLLLPSAPPHSVLPGQQRQSQQQLGHPTLRLQEGQR
jgi:hypothetical protein